MNQERPSDVPYSVSDAGCLVFRNGRGVVNFDSRRDAINAASLANRSHAEGRKAAEKNGLEELCFPLLRKIDIQEKEFKELLALAKDMREFITDECLDSRKVVAGDFDAWKKARGIE
jgi:hypothetical protein